MTLTGHGENYSEKVDAERTTQRVRGVRAIAEEIQVRYPFDKQTADDQIAHRALSVIGWDVRVPLDSVKVKVEKGFVTLTGKVHWHFEKEAAEFAVRKLSGVTGVFNMIELKPHPSTVDVKAKIMGALKRDAELEAGSIRVTIRDDKVHLEGQVKGFHERLVAERAAWSVPGVMGVEDRLTLAA